MMRSSDTALGGLGVSQDAMSPEGPHAADPAAKGDAESEEVIRGGSQGKRVGWGRWMHSLWGSGNVSLKQMVT